MAITDLLKVPGAQLYYEVRGSGPVLLLIVGGNGDAGTFTQAAKLLADRYTVITYERRGFFRSPLDGPVPENRIETDAQDADRLLGHFTDEPAYVFGSSSGAIVALDLTVRHPARIRTVVAHEPPLFTLLPDAEHWRSFINDVYQTYRAEGVQPAMKEFGAEMGMPNVGQRAISGVMPPEMAEMAKRIPHNLKFWLDNELRQYPSYVPDVAALTALSDRIVLAAGLDGKANPPYQPNTVLAEQFGSTIANFAGGHVGYLTHPAEFAARLHDVLAS
ncbi:MAG TPA: alpha/beta hydrolase [Pseudonocardiaceae bacterium]|nr:alpha/beta hydrolase [Pseudonocardiaceae bacterium]